MSDDNKNLGLYKLHFDCGRQGCLEGLFISEIKEMKKLIQGGESVYFGEALGKHSEICGPIEDVDVTFISDNKDVIELVKDNKLENGYNPFHYLENE